MAIPDIRGESFACFCGERRAHPVLAGDGFTILRCPACGACRTDPAPLEQEPLTTPGVEDYLKHAGKYRAILSEVLEEVTLQCAGGTLLDVGCSVGHLMDLAEEAGFEAYGIETNPLAARHARERYGERVQQGPIEEATFSAAFFDAITANAVLEHVADPVAFLVAARRLLRPGGVVVVGVPNFGGWASRFEGNRWYGLQPAGHIWQYTPSSLTAVLRRAGFEPVRVRTNQLHRKYGPSWRSRTKKLLFDAFELVQRGDGLLATARPMMCNGGGA